VPELPEVETIRACLEPKLVGRRIESVWVRQGSRLLRDTVGPAQLRRRLTGRGIEGLGRRGKYLILVLDTGEYFVVHLGMTGMFYTAAPDAPSPRHTHLRLKLADADLLLVDPRTFGRVFVLGEGELQAHPVFRRLGPEPLDRAFTVAYLADRLRGRRTPIKALLLGQQLAAGIGNIYADESCHAARILPRRAAGSLEAREIAALRRAVRGVLRRSIACQGTTIRDYQWDEGRSGGFAAKLKVYGRQGRPCRRCGGLIERNVLAGRSTFFCPGCQF
jgi:formamidopyrimidine-DNA glycosylase